MIPAYDNIPKDILDYINSHPAYGLLTTAKVDWDLWHAGFVDRIEPYKDFQRIFWGGGTGDTPVPKGILKI